MSDPGEIPVSPDGNPMTKVVFDLDQDDEGWPPVGSERLWGEKTGKAELRLLNTPFFVRGIAFGDRIRIRPDHERREFLFDGVVAESDHSTVRIVFVRGDDGREAVESRLRDAGCDIGTLSQFPNLIAVNVPPTADYGELRAWLSAQAGVVEFEEGAISALHRGRPA
ncbi:DUF4265 domain-containing protein [Lentzea sp. JNUCC 0626]|uniref:DUF4265 domain-containing protein n=1 Tax=Lentzea sp. JNUCC 0626 TaxID=3367513 RepID=UPI0037490DD4